MKVGEVIKGRERALNAIQNNQSSIQSAASQYGVDQRLIESVIYEEQSHLKPDEALGREQIFPNAGNGGVGVMQVSGKVGSEHGNYSKTE